MMPGWEIVDDAPKPKSSGGWEVVDDSAPKSEWRDTQYGFKVKSGLAPTGEQATIREDGAINFPGEKGWKLFDPKTGIYAPAPDRPTGGWLDRNLGPEAIKSWYRNVKAGLQAPLDATTSLMEDTARAMGITGDKRYREQIAMYDERARQREAIKNTSGTGAGFTQGSTAMAPAVAAMMLAPEAAPTVFASEASMVPTATTFLARSAASAIPGAGAAYVTTPGDTKERVKAALATLAAEPVARFGGEKVVAPIAKAVSRRVGAALSGALPREAQAVQDLGDRFGVRVLAPDMAPSPTLNKAGVLMESVPGAGMLGQRQAQQAEARAAAEKLLAQHGIEGDVSTTIQQGLANRLAEGKSNAKAAYDLVGKLAEGKGDVPLESTLNAIRAARAAEESAALPDQGLVGLLGKMESRLTDPKADVDTSYNGVRGLRSDLGNMISDYYKGTNAATGSKGVQVLQGVKNAIEDDLSAFASKSGPEISSAAKQADSIYKSQVVPFKDQMLAKAVKSSEPDQIYRTMIQAGKGDRAQKFYNALDADGQAAVRAQMVSDAFANATKKEGTFSPAEFAGSLEKIKEAAGVFFKGQDKFELDGFTNLMRHVQRAGQIGENPPTGARLVTNLIAGEGIGAAAGAMTGHPVAAVPLALSSLSSRGLTQMFKSKMGKAFLLAASDAKPGSEAMTRLIERDLPKVLSGSTGTAAPNVVPFRPQAPIESVAKNEE